ncbi:MAG: hypothetical protein JWN97_798, partial [Nocardioides sp.]|nr:hypothetical protein [Nocardioides sp.]
SAVAAAAAVVLVAAVATGGVYSATPGRSTRPGR